MLNLINTDAINSSSRIALTAEKARRRSVDERILNFCGKQDIEDAVLGLLKVYSHHEIAAIFETTVSAFQKYLVRRGLTRNKVKSRIQKQYRNYKNLSGNICSEKAAEAYHLFHTKKLCSIKPEMISRCA